MVSGTSYVAEMLSESYRGKNIKPNPNNKFTAARRRTQVELEGIDATQGNEAGFNRSVDMVTANLPAVQRYILGKGETPLSDPIDLARQAYDLRCQEVQAIADAMDVSFGEAQIAVEQAEAQSAEVNSPEADSFLGGLFAAIGNIAGNAVQNAAIKRAEQGKKPGILGALTPGYAQLQEYLRNNPQMKGKVTLNEQGQIIPIVGYENAGYTDGGVNVSGQSVMDAVAVQARKAALKKALPFIIGGLIVIVLIVIFVARASSKHK